MSKYFLLKWLEGGVLSCQGEHMKESMLRHIYTQMYKRYIMTGQRKDYSGYRLTLDTRGRI